MRHLAPCTGAMSSPNGSSPNGIRTRVATMRERVHMSLHVRLAPGAPVFSTMTSPDVHQCPRRSPALMGKPRLNHPAGVE